MKEGKKKVLAFQLPPEIFRANLPSNFLSLVAFNLFLNLLALTNRMFALTVPNSVPLFVKIPLPEHLYLH